MRKFVFSMVGLVLALGLVAFGRSVAAAPAFQHPRFSATLTGAAEAPGPGDTDGSGRAAVAFQADVDVCFTITAANITLPAAAAHIHRGAEGVAGPIVVPLQPPAANGGVDGCTTGDRAILSEIMANPAAFYVNVHTSDFPQGAIRGQLAALQGDDGAAAPAQTMPGTGQNSSTMPLVLTVAALVLLAGVALRLFTRRRPS